MIETFAPDRADEPLGEGVLPRAVGRGQHFMDPQALHSVLERVTVDAVAIAEEIGRRAVLRERAPGAAARNQSSLHRRPAPSGGRNEDPEDSPETPRLASTR